MTTALPATHHARFSLRRVMSATVSSKFTASATASSTFEVDLVLLNISAART